MCIPCLSVEYMYMFVQYLCVLSISVCCVCRSVCLSEMHICLSVCLPVCLNVSLSVCLYTCGWPWVCVCVCEYYVCYVRIVESPTNTKSFYGFSTTNLIISIDRAKLAPGDDQLVLSWGKVGLTRSPPLGPLAS